MNIRDKNLAKSVLATLRGQAQTAANNQYARAARRVLDGKGDDTDLELLRNYRGIRRSGAGAIKMYMKASHVAANITRDVDLLKTGSPFAVPRLTHDISGVLLKAFKSNRSAMTKLGESFAKQMGLDPALSAQFVASVGRALRLGGVVATLTSLAYEAGMGYAAGAEKAAGSDREIRERLASLKNRQAEESILKQARSEARLQNWWNFGLDAGAQTNSQIQERVNAISAKIAARREMMSFGGSKVMADVAAQTKVPASLLTERELNAYLDEMGQGFLDAPAAESDAYTKRKLSELPWYTSNAGRKVQEARFRSEFSKEWMDRQIQKRRDREEAGQTAWKNMSLADYRSKVLDAELGIARRAEYRSRYSARALED